MLRGFGQSFPTVMSAVVLLSTLMIKGYMPAGWGLILLISMISIGIVVGRGFGGKSGQIVLSYGYLIVSILMSILMLTGEVPLQITQLMGLIVPIFVVIIIFYIFLPSRSNN